MCVTKQFSTIGVDKSKGVEGNVVVEFELKSTRVECNLRKSNEDGSLSNKDSELASMDHDGLVTDIGAGAGLIEETMGHINNWADKAHYGFKRWKHFPRSNMGESFFTQVESRKRKGQ